MERSCPTPRKAAIFLAQVIEFEYRRHRLLILNLGLWTRFSSSVHKPNHLTTGPSPFIMGSLHNPPLGGTMAELLRRIWSDEEGQDIAEYAVMLAVILVLVVGTIRLIGTNANSAFSSVASSIQ